MIWVMKLNYKKIGDCINITNEKNKSGEVDLLLGININKNFMPSVANTSETDLSKYKVIRENHFACNIMHVGRDERLPISLYKNTFPAIVSPAYKTFEIIDFKELLPEFLMIFFKRKSFDHLAWYLSDSSVRGGLDWNRFCDIEIPVPKIDIQEKYSAIFKYVESKKVLNEKIKDISEPLFNLLIEKF